MSRRKKQPDKRQMGLGMEVEEVAEVVREEPPAPRRRAGTCRYCGALFCVICGRVGYRDADDQPIKNAILDATGRGTVVHRLCQKEDRDALWPLPDHCESCPKDEQGRMSRPSPYPKLRAPFPLHGGKSHIAEIWSGSGLVRCRCTPNRAPAGWG